MAQNFIFKLNRAGVSELLRSTEAATVVTETANRIASSAGSGYAVDTQRGRTRVHARVKPVTKEATNDNFRNNTLLKAMRAAKQ